MNLDLAAIAQARADLAAQRDAQRNASVQARAAQDALDAALRSGVGAQQLEQQQAAVAKARGAARDAAAATQARLAAVGRLAEGFAVGLDPALLVGTLATDRPVALLPVALQTRFSADNQRLMIRIYPDAIHAMGHEPALAPNEVVEGKRYWTLRFAVPGDTASPWQQITAIYPPTRAAFIVRTTTPTNLADLGQAPNGELLGPAFDDAAIALGNPEAQQVFAVALPPKFVAIGYRAGREIFRRWGGTVSDLVPLSPVFDPLLAGDPKTYDPFAGDRAWMVDYAAALAAGLAITVTPSDLPPGLPLAGPIDRLVVLGVDWTHTPEQAATLLGQLLDNHQHGDGLAFLAHGTPTNNTDATRAGFAANGADVAPALEPGATAARSAAAAAELASAGARLQALLGLPSAVFDAGAVPGGDNLDGAAAGHLLNALWNATLGYTLRYFWNPLDTSQSLIGNDANDQLRAWAVRFLRPGGPLAALRVGKQPYGLLPITARGFQAEAASPIETEVARAVDWFRGFWDAAVQRGWDPVQHTGVPTLQDPSAESLHQVLATQPWAASKRFMQVAGPAVGANYPKVLPYQMFQFSLLGRLAASLLGHQPSELQKPFVATCTVRDKPNSLDMVPWVQPDPDHAGLELEDDAPLRRNYIAELANDIATKGSGLRAALVAREDADSLLEALLAFAADEELLRSGFDLFHGHVNRLPNVPLAIKQSVQRFRPAEYLHVANDVLGDQVAIGSATSLLQLQLQGTTNGLTIAEHLGKYLGLEAAQWPEVLQNIATFTDSLAALQGRSSHELSLGLRGTLDLFAWRLDAWITSLATHRLERLRDSQPAGLHLGAFGVVENLLPDSLSGIDTARDSLGYVHAPSLRQAATAAILHSAHVANREAAGDAFNIDLRSRRVQRAKRLLEGLANGQPMAALVGYRFERAMRDQGLPQYVFEFRQAFPLRPAGDLASDQAQESIAARDVVDGVRLVEAYRQAGNTLAVAGVLPDHPEARATINAVLDDLVEQLDAVSDLLLAESVFQIAGGNMDAAGAAINVLDKQDRPPETRVVASAHSARGYSQRVVVALPAGGAPGGWGDLVDLPSQVEPRLNAWLAGLFGDPARYAFQARVLQQVTVDVGGKQTLQWQDAGGPALTIGLAQLGLSALSLVLQSESKTQGGQSGVQEVIGLMLAAQLRADPALDPTKTALVLDEAGPDGQIGLAAFESFAWLLRRLLEKARPLRRPDLTLARDGTETAATVGDGEAAGVDLAELEGRLATADAAAADALQALADAVAAVSQALSGAGLDPLDPSLLDAGAPATQALAAGLQSALSKAYALGWRAALPSTAVAETATSTQGEQVTPQDGLPQAFARARALRSDMQARLDAAPAPMPAIDPVTTAVNPLAARVDAAVKRIRAVLGDAFPVLPVFTLGDHAGEAQATLDDRDSLLAKAALGTDDLTVAGWLPKLGCVREATARLSDVLSAAEALGETTGYTSAPLDLKLLQFPRDARARWGALPRDTAPLAPGETRPDLRGAVAVVAHAPALAAIAPAATLAGLFIDEWSESIPAEADTTGLSFHVDAAGARPPQCVLLAVPADRAQPAWSLDALLATVTEAMDLARVRAVRPQDLQGLGLLLPGLYLSNNYQHDVPSIDWGRRILATVEEARAGQVLKATVLAEGKTVLSS